MRILLLGDINSPHLQRWAVSLAERGLILGIWSLSGARNDWYSQHAIQVLSKGENQNIFGKLAYYQAPGKVRKAIQEFRPDVLHAHYASSYGMLARKSRFHPYFVSVWGSDVTVFPLQSRFRKKIVRKNLQAADRVFATSEMLKSTVAAYFSQDCIVLPFGVDPTVFFPGKVNHYFEKNTWVIGAVKSLEPVYALHTLIMAFSQLQKKRNNWPLRLLIAGSGSEEMKLKQLAEKHCLAGTFCFTGKVNYDKVPDIHREIDVFVNPSISESFGVSVIEASACGKPVVLSNAGGLTEVAVEGESGLFFQPENMQQLAEKIEMLLADENLRRTMGEKGKQFVDRKYNWNTILDVMVDYYSKAKRQ